VAGVRDLPAGLRYGFAMTIEYLTRHWALVIASVLGTAILLFIVFRALQDSVGGRLRAAVRYLRDRERALQDAARVISKAEANLERLQAKAESVAPRQGEKAREALVEAQETWKLVEDQMLIGKNNVRMLILEEYPPKRHEAMRKSYLSEEAE